MSELPDSREPRAPARRRRERAGGGAIDRRRVRKQPFSVLLLDEFEKAHANVWDVFLQVFDDGRLTDRNGRTVDLRHCVIILTSNLGSAIPTGPGLRLRRRGGVLRPGETVIKSVERAFRPEFLNRLDRIVVFRPLGREIMRNLLEHELTGVLARRGFRTRPWAVEWDEAAIDFLIEKGFSAELGARPLKRAIEQHLLTRLATTIVERDFPAGDQFLFITARDSGRLDVHFVDPDADDSAPAAPEDSDTSLTLARVALDPGGIGVRGCVPHGRARERVKDTVQTCEALKEEALARTREAGFWQSDDCRAVLSEVEYLDRLAAATATASRLAARLGPARGTHSRELVGILARRLHVLAAALRGLAADEARDAQIAIRPSRQDAADATTAVRGGARVDVRELGRRERDARSPGRGCERTRAHGRRARRVHAPPGRDRRARSRAAGGGGSLIPACLRDRDCHSRRSRRARLRRKSRGRFGALGRAALPPRPVTPRP